MRERAVERFSQTKKRQEETEKDEGKKEKKRIRRGNRIVERKRREYARDEGARTSRKKGRTRSPKSSN